MARRPRGRWRAGRRPSRALTPTSSGTDVGRCRSDARARRGALDPRAPRPRRRVPAPSAASRGGRRGRAASAPRPPRAAACPRRIGTPSSCPPPCVSGPITIPASSTREPRRVARPEPHGQQAGDRTGVGRQQIDPACLKSPACDALEHPSNRALVVILGVSQTDQDGCERVVAANRRREGHDGHGTLAPASRRSIARRSSGGAAAPNARSRARCASASRRRPARRSASCQASRARATRKRRVSLRVPPARPRQTFPSRRQVASRRPHTQRRRVSAIARASGSPRRVGALDRQGGALARLEHASSREQRRTATPSTNADGRLSRARGAPRSERQCSIDGVATASAATEARERAPLLPSGRRAAEAGPATSRARQSDSASVSRPRRSAPPPARSRAANAASSSSSHAGVPRRVVEHAIGVAAAGPARAAAGPVRSARRRQRRKRDGVERAAALSRSSRSAAA